MNKMQITPHSGISADGFIVKIINLEGNVIKKHAYSYGYNASYNPTNDERRPYTTDIITKLMDTYKVKLEDITVVPGIYVFSGDKMGEKEVNEFKEDYMKELK